MRVALARRVILREDHAVRWPFKVAADPPTGQEAKPLGVRQDLCAIDGAKGIYQQLCDRCERSASQGRARNVDA
jgi:hypothetical protein